MNSLADLINNSQPWLIQRVVNYAKQNEYAKYSSPLEEDWRASVNGLSQAILQAYQFDSQPIEFKPDTDYSQDERAAFAIHEARMHRQRGLRLEMFLGLFKYYEQSYIDLVHESALKASQKAAYKQFLYRFFHFIELGFCSEWSRQTQNDLIDELQTTNRLITNEKNRYLTIFESLSHPVLLLDQDFCLDNMNRAAFEIFMGIHKPGAFQERKKYMPQIFPWLEELCKQWDPNHLAPMPFQKELNTLYGIRHFDGKLQVIRDISEKFTGFIVILTDLTDHMTAEKQLRYMAVHDALTGLYNRAYFEEELERLARGRQFPVGVVMVDVDRLKTVNDTQGHAAGDALLRRAARLLKESFRGEDMIARIGGDEFVVLIPNAQKENFQQVVERLRRQLIDLQSDISQTRLNLSLGTATAHDSHSLLFALQNADENMYTEKKSKRLQR